MCKQPSLFSTAVEDQIKKQLQNQSHNFVKVEQIEHQR